MKAALPELDGIEATRRIREHDREIRVILLSDEADDHELGLDALRAGAIGFLPRRIALEPLPRVLRGAMAGEAAISRRLAMALWSPTGRPPRVGAGLRPVRSELDRPRVGGAGPAPPAARTEEIAQALVLSPETVAVAHEEPLPQARRPLAARRRSRPRSACASPASPV